MFDLYFFKLVKRNSGTQSDLFSPNACMQEFCFSFNYDFPLAKWHFFHNVSLQFDQLRQNAN